MTRLCDRCPANDSKQPVPRGQACSSCPMVLPEDNQQNVSCAFYGLGCFLPTVCFLAATLLTVIFWKPSAENTTVENDSSSQAQTPSGDQGANINEPGDDPVSTSTVDSSSSPPPTGSNDSSSSATPEPSPQSALIVDPNWRLPGEWTKTEFKFPSGPLVQPWIYDYSATWTVSGNQQTRHGRLAVGPASDSFTINAENRPELQAALADADHQLLFFRDDLDPETSDLVDVQGQDQAWLGHVLALPSGWAIPASETYVGSSFPFAPVELAFAPISDLANSQWAATARYRTRSIPPAPGQRTGLTRYQPRPTLQSIWQSPYVPTESEQASDLGAVEVPVEKTYEFKVMFQTEAVCAVSYTLRASWTPDDRPRVDLYGLGFLVFERERGRIAFHHVSGIMRFFDGDREVGSESLEIELSLKEPLSLEAKRGLNFFTTGPGLFFLEEPVDAEGVTLESEWKLMGPAGIQRMSLSPDGKWLAAATRTSFFIYNCDGEPTELEEKWEEYGPLAVWDEEEPVCFHVLPRKSKMLVVDQLTRQEDGRWETKRLEFPDTDVSTIRNCYPLVKQQLLLVSDVRSLAAYDLSTLQQRWKSPLPPGSNLMSVATGTTHLKVASDRALYDVDLETGDITEIVAIPTSRNQSTRQTSTRCPEKWFSQDGQTLWLPTDDGIAEIDGETGETRRVITDYPNAISLSVMHDRNWLVIQTETEICFYDPETDGEVADLFGAELGELGRWMQASTYGRRLLISKPFSHREVRFIELAPWQE